MEHTSNNLSCHDLIKLLREGNKYLHELPSMRTTNFALYFSERLNQFVYASVAGNSITDPIFIEPSKFQYFFASTKHPHGYSKSFLSEIKFMHPLLQKLDEYIKQADGIMYKLKQQPDCCYQVRSGLLIQHKPVIEWYGMSKPANNKLFESVYTASTVYRLIINNLIASSTQVNINQLPAIFRARSRDISDSIVQNFGDELLPNRLYFLDGLNAILMYQKNIPVLIKFAVDEHGFIVPHKDKNQIESLLKSSEAFFKSRIFDWVKNAANMVSVRMNIEVQELSKFPFLDLSAIFQPHTAQQYCIEKQGFVQCGLSGYHETMSTEDAEHLYSPVQRVNFNFEAKFLECLHNDGFVKITFNQP